MKESGFALNEILDKQFLTVDVENPEDILYGLQQSGMMYHAKSTDNKVMIAFSGIDKDRIEQLIHRNTHSNEDLLERMKQYRTDSSNVNRAKALLPEISEILHVSVSSLERKPPDLQIQLALTYTCFYHADDLTIKNALQDELSLNHEAVSEVQQLEIEKQHPNISNPINGIEQLHQQEEIRQEEKKRTTPFTSRDVLKRNAQRIREDTVNGERKHVVEKDEELERIKK